jgi:outer membrane protein
MNPRSSALFAVLLAAAPAAPALAAPAAVPLSLDRAFAAALTRSETLAERGETYAQLQAQIDQLWAAVQPRVELRGTQEWQDAGGGGGSFPIPTSQPTALINAHQPLFSGLREYLAVRAGREESESARQALARAKQLLYRDVAQAYLNLLGSHMDIAVREAQEKLDQDRIKELQDFVRIGRSRESEILAARSLLAQNDADLATARGQERGYQAALRFLTGLDGDLQPADVPPPGPAPEDEKDYLSRADARPDVAAARADLKYASIYESMQSRQRWPTIGVDGNYYLKRPRNVYQHVRWDVSVNGMIPLYYGGEISAQVRQAEAQRRSKEQALSLARRTAELEVRTAYTDLSSGLEIVSALEKAKSLAEANAAAQEKDYRDGLVTNLDVLNSLTTVQDTRLRLDQARNAAYYARVRLEVAAGGPESAR